MLGKNLRMLRENLGISQSELAKRLHISRQSYNFYENSKREPDLYLVKKLAAFFDVSIDCLIGYTAACCRPCLYNNGDSDELTKSIHALSLEDRAKVHTFIKFLEFSKNPPP